MQTCCPNCSTIYNVTSHQLTVANGQVQCSACKQVFNARENSLPQAEKSPDIQITLTEPPAILKKRLLGKKINPVVLSLWIIGSLLATLTLAAQLSWIYRHDLAQHSIFGQHIKTLCHYLPQCRLQSPRNLAALELLSRQIYTHPNENNALIVSAVFTNNAEFAQPYPHLLVSMSDKKGNTVAQRYFAPAEYSPDHTNNNIASGATVSVNLALQDPGKDALAFEIDFL